jgi:IMP dehydrogenase/GMP reductase
MTAFIKKFLTFDDVCMIPKFNTIASRTHTCIKTNLHHNTYDYPFVPANMDTVISKSMVKKLNELNGMIIYHIFCYINEKLELLSQYPKMYMSVGISEEEKQTIV